MTTQEILEAARRAKTAVALSDSGTRDSALLGMADALCAPESMDAILAANAEDMAAAKGRISDVMLDRLALTPQRIEAMAKGIRDVAALPDPVGRVLSHIERPNGLVIEKTAVPMGVIAIIYESRPNVTSDAAALAIKSGNACILRCGKEAWRSANAIVQALRQGLRANGLPETAVCLIEDTTHASANALMTAVGYVDLLIPRGGAGLIRACVENAKVPCIQTGTGICHIFVDDTADQTKALDIIENAKASRPSVCNAEEVCLVHSAIASEFLPKLAQRLGPDRTAKGLHPVRPRVRLQPLRRYPRSRVRLQPLRRHPFRRYFVLRPQPPTLRIPTPPRPPRRSPVSSESSDHPFRLSLKFCQSLQAFLKSSVPAAIFSSVRLAYPSITVDG